jgi:hypothetical protein
LRLWPPQNDSKKHAGANKTRSQKASRVGPKAAAGGARAGTGLP